MKFNKGRFAKLAGIPQSRGTLNESRYRASQRRQALLNESLYGGRAELDMVDNLDIMDNDEYEAVPFDEFDFDEDGISMARQDKLRRRRADRLERGYDDFGPEDYESEIYGDDEDDDWWMGEGVEKDEDGEEDEDKDVVEIDDKELMKEVRNIKRKRINEARLKAVIEDELREVLAEVQYGSSWMYGDEKPQASRKGHVTRGFKGLGFK